MLQNSFCWSQKASFLGMSRGWGVCSYTLLILSSTWKKWLGFKDGGRRPVCSTTKRVSEYCCVSHSFDLWALDSGKNMVSFAKFQDYKVVVSNPLYLIFASLDVHVLSCSQRMTGYAAAFSSNIIYQGFSQAFLSTIREKIGKHQSTVRRDDSEWSRDFSEGFASGIFCQSRWNSQSIQSWHGYFGGVVFVLHCLAFPQTTCFM